MAIASSQTNDKAEEEVQVEKVVEEPQIRKKNRKEVDEGTDKGTPIRYVPLSDLYTATSRCVSGSSSLIMSKKVKARKLTLLDFNFFKPSPSPPPSQPLPPSPSPPPPLMHPPPPMSPVQSTPPSSSEDTSKPPVMFQYSRQHPKRNRHCSRKPSFLASSLAMLSNVQSNGSPHTQLLVKVEEEVQAEEGDEDERLRLRKKRKKKRSELEQLVIESSSLEQLSGSRSRPSRSQNLTLEKESATNRPNSRNGNASQSIKNGSSAKDNNDNPEIVNSAAAKRWVMLKIDGVDPKKFIGLQCKIHWPLDDEWYSGHVVGYNAETGRHNVTYEDGDEENVIISNEKIKFYVSRDEMQRLNLSCSSKSPENEELDFSEMVALAASFDDCHELGPGDILWVKLTGHAMWPGVVVDESLLLDRKGLNKTLGVKSVPVQFFGTHDFARVKTNQVVTFLKGLLSSLHLKCKKPHFIQSLEEAKMYLSEQKLPKRMLRMRKGVEGDGSNSDSQQDEDRSYSDDDCAGVGKELRLLEGLKSCPLEIGDLQVISLGKIVKDSDHFQDEKFIWPVGYTAVRKFHSTTDPSTCTFYKMEVLRDTDLRTRPLFRVTTDNGDQFKGSTPSVCWNKIFKKIRKVKDNSDGSMNDVALEKSFQSGSDMFGFSDPAVLKLIKELSNSKRPLKSSLSPLTSQSQHDLPTGYRPVHVKWKDLDKCNVCHMDEEYKNNLFMQCDKCRMMVHAKCYGELEPVDGNLWLCNLCRPGAPDTPPPCCLCPVIGGAMKPTSDGRWAHLACAMWIPETCLSDIKKMEPIDGLNRINKDRWKLLCSVCGVPYGACIQCSNNTCRVAYHPLCARVAGFCVELEDEDRLHVISMDEDEEEQCIRLFSYCKKHRPLSSDRLAADDQMVPKALHYSDYTPPCNPSGCARSEPYNNLGRRGRLEPEALAAASLKRLFVENRPYLVGGFSQHEVMGDTPSSTSDATSNGTHILKKLKALHFDAPKDSISMVEKYTYMRDTFRKRLAFGKSGIHGFGIFAKQAHRAGDMVIEYTGELVRPPVADRREHLIYNSLVGAGTYMFRIDDERVIDATRAGSIAHLINHSCEPNCYSRVISVSGDEHIIIFAKRDIKQWEELTYDYRFFSIDEQLACYCGFPRCRGIVNDVDAEEQLAKLHIRRSELIDWRGE